MRKFLLGERFDVIDGVFLCFICLVTYDYGVLSLDFMMVVILFIVATLIKGIFKDA